MPSNHYAYPFDPNGTSDDNIVSDEYQAISPVQQGEFHYIIPRRAPFYRDGFKLWHVETGEELKEGVDFHFGHQFQAATLNTAKAVYGSIVFLRYDLAGNVRIGQYRTVGGPWTLDEVTIVGLLVQRHLNPRTTYWDNVVNLPTAFPPVDHEFSVDDLVGMSDVTTSLSNIREAILQKAQDDNAPDEEGVFSGYARQYVFDPVYDQMASWTMLGSLNLVDSPTSDLVLMVAGAEEPNTTSSPVYMLTLGVHAESVAVVPPAGQDPDPIAMDVELSVVNLSTSTSLSIFGYKKDEAARRVELWMSTTAHRSSTTLNDLSRGHQYLFSPAVVYQEPIGVVWASTFDVGRSPAQDSTHLGGYAADDYVRKDHLTSVIASIQETLDHLSADPSNPGMTYAPEYFVSRNQFFYAMNDLIADVDGITAHLNDETVLVPDLITEVPAYLDTPTGLIEYFISRMEVTFTLQEFKDAIATTLQRLVDTGQLESTEALLDRIDVGSAITIPFPGGSIESSTQSAAINYLSKTEFNQIMGEVMYVINEMILSLQP